MTIKRRRRFQSKRLRDAAKGQACVLCEHWYSRHRRVGPDETVVACHLPGSEYGMAAGMGQKTHDWLAAHLCDDHHRMMDGKWRRAVPTRMLALCLTLDRLFEQGVIVVAGE